MDKEKRSNEGEMGSGDSDDEFYKLPYNPAAAADKPSEKREVKKVYSPSRTKVKYDYKFDSSSDDEAESGSCKRNSEMKGKEVPDGVKGETQNEKSESKETTLPENTYKVVEKINEELKNMKNSKGMTEKLDGAGTNQSSITASMASGVNVARPQLGVVPPVVVVPPMVIPQGPVMNMGPMIVSSPVGMAGQNIIPGHMMGMAGNMLRGHTPMGGLMANSNTAMSSNMIGMNPVPGIAGIMGMQSNLVGLQGNAMTGQGNVMGLQAGMINPAMSGMNMAMQGNMMRMAAAGNSLLHMQRPSGSMMGVQASRPSSTIMGMTRPIGVSGSANSLLGMQSHGSGVLTNAAGVVVNPTNPMVGNPGPGLMVMGGVMGNVGTPNLVGATQPNILVANTGNVVVNNNMVRMIGNTPGTAPIRPIPPPPFLNLRNRPPNPGNIKWPVNPRIPGAVAKGGSPTTAAVPVTSFGNPSPASSPADRGNGQYDGDDFSREDKDISPSDRSSTLETDESQSPPRELPNTFKNDGSFMEMFKRMKDEKNLENLNNSEKGRDSSEASSAAKKPPVILSGIVGKRRGGRVLKTGLVKKVKKESETEEEKHPKDAWSMYMAEVKKYREASCEEEGKTRPLVK